MNSNVVTIRRMERNWAGQLLTPSLWLQWKVLGWHMVASQRPWHSSMEWWSSGAWGCAPMRKDERITRSSNKPPVFIATFRGHKLRHRNIIYCRCFAAVWFKIKQVHVYKIIYSFYVRKSSLIPSKWFLFHTQVVQVSVSFQTSQTLLGGGEIQVPNLRGLFPSLLWMIRSAYEISRSGFQNCCMCNELDQLVGQHLWSIAAYKYFACRLRRHFLKKFLFEDLLLHSGGGSCGLWLHLRQWSAGIQTDGSGVVLCLLLSSLFQHCSPSMLELKFVFLLW